MLDNACLQGLGLDVGRSSRPVTFGLRADIALFLGLVGQAASRHGMPQDDFANMT